MQRFVVLVALLLVFGLAVWGVAQKPEPGKVQVVKLSEGTWEQVAPHGKEVDAIYGDFVLKNEYLTAVIAQPKATRHANMTVRDVGGCLIDLTTNAGQSDQLSAFYPSRRQHRFTEATLYADGEPLDAGWTSMSADETAVEVRSPAGPGQPEVKVRYTLTEGSRSVAVTTTYTNPHAADLPIRPEDELRIDTGSEDVARIPNGEGTFYWIHDKFWGQAYGISVDDPVSMRFVNGSRTTTFQYLTDGKREVILKQGESLSVTRQVYPARNGWEVHSFAAADQQAKTGTVKMSLRDKSGNPLDGAVVALTRDGKPFGSAKTDAKGRITSELLAGEYHASITDLGLPVRDGLAFQVVEGENAYVLDLVDYAPGTLKVQVTDSSGEPLPAKIEIVSKEGTPTVNLGPISGDDRIRNLLYAYNGTATQRLPAGTYDLLISHGPEYEIAEASVTLADGAGSSIQAELARPVDTTGYLSSDFHSHSSPSGDNTGSQRGRVMNLVCEHIEFAPCTEHNRVSTYVPHIEALQITKHIATVSGMELTGRPLPLNHQNVFPMHHHPHEQDGGGPTVAADPVRQVERIAFWDDRSEKLIQQNHPDLGWLIYDKDGDGEPDGGYQQILDHIDVVEIHPIDKVWSLGPTEKRGAREQNHRIFNWLQMLNQGMRLYGVVNTDAHYNFHGSGGLRNWIVSSTDDPSEADVVELRENSEQGHLVMSNGPFLTVTATAPTSDRVAIVGDDFKSGGKAVRLHVKVQSPSWIAVDDVVVLANGRPLEKLTFNRESHPDMFKEGVVKFDATLELNLEADMHLIVVAGDRDGRLGPVFGPDWGKQHPAALTNPIFVDIDGNGFEANKDTLGHPLPVKYRK